MQPVSQSGNNSRRNFLGRVSATSFLDSVGGMIPGSSPETEQLPEARVSCTVQHCTCLARGIGQHLSTPTWGHYCSHLPMHLALQFFLSGQA